MNIFKKLIAEILIDVLKGRRAILEAETAVAKKIAGSGTRHTRIETFEEANALKIAHLNAEIGEQQAKIDAITAPLTFKEAAAEVGNAVTPEVAAAVAKVEATVAPVVAAVEVHLQ